MGAMGAAPAHLPPELAAQFAAVPKPPPPGQNNNAVNHIILNLLSA